jgi:hypothetical protein
MRKQRSGSRDKKELFKAADVERRTSFHLYGEYYQSATTEQKRNADLLREYGNGLFSKEEIIDIVWGRKGVIRLLLPTIWFRPKDVLEQSDALIYLIRIVTGKKCDGSERIELNSRDFDVVAHAFADGLRSENIRSSKARSLNESIAYSRRRVKDLLNKSPELNGDEKYVPANFGARLGQGSQNPQVRELNKLLKSSKLTEDQRAEILSQIETVQTVHARQKQRELINFSLIDPKLLEKLGLNADGSRKKKSA